MRRITYAEAADEALQEEFRRDDRTVFLATDMNELLLEEFGEERVRSTPISESAFVGAAIGLAGSGFRPIVDIRMATFGFVAMDQLMNQAAKITYMFGGQAKFPILYRMTVGTGISGAAQHSINPYPMYMNIPGLKIILPSTPYDMKGLLKTAIRDNNPVISFEHMGLEELMGEVPEEEYTLPLGQALTRKEGDDVTVVALAKMVHLSLEVMRQNKISGVRRGSLANIARSIEKRPREDRPAASHQRIGPQQDNCEKHPMNRPGEPGPLLPRADL